MRKTARWAALPPWKFAPVKLYAIRAKDHHFLATGGCGRIFEPSTNALIVTGDGMALAYNAGAGLMDMEMVQYHPTTLAGSGVLLSEAARGEGAYLRDKDGNRFMEKVRSQHDGVGLPRRGFPGGTDRD